MADSENGDSSDDEFMSDSSSESEEEEEGDNNDDLSQNASKNASKNASEGEEDNDDDDLFADIFSNEESHSKLEDILNRPTNEVSLNASQKASNVAVQVSLKASELLSPKTNILNCPTNKMSLNASDVAVEVSLESLTKKTSPKVASNSSSQNDAIQTSQNLSSKVAVKPSKNTPRSVLRQNVAIEMSQKRRNALKSQYAIQTSLIASKSQSSEAVVSFSLDDVKKGNVEEEDDMFADIFDDQVRQVRQLR
jgi:hypothetical protein